MNMQASPVKRSCAARMRLRLRRMAKSAALIGLLSSPGHLFGDSGTADAAAGKSTAQTASAISMIDLRIDRLRSFFRHYRCPNPLYISDYIRVADRNGLDYRILPAISVRETQCGVSERNNNRFGFHPGVARFASVPAAIEFVGDRIANHPLYKDLNLRDLLFRFNPRVAYPGEVQFLMRQIEP